MKLSAGVTERIATGIAIEVPPGYEAQVRGRSGLALQGVHVHPGTIDSDYRGEVCVIATKLHGSGRHLVLPGDRIAQLVISPIATPKLVEVKRLNYTERGEGGFGSTGR